MISTNFSSRLFWLKILGVVSSNFTVAPKYKILQAASWCQETHATQCQDSVTLALKHNDARLVNDIATMLGCDTGRRHIHCRLRHIWGTSDAAGGNNRRHICRDSRFLARLAMSTTTIACCARWSGTNKGCPSGGRRGNIVHLDCLLIAAAYTLITFVCQLILG